MRICVLVPSKEYLVQAGVRIRYHRIQDDLRTVGSELTISPIDELRPSPLDADVYLFSKCNDARASVAANVLAKAGKLIGVDLFDDYFSQRTDNRFGRLREWARSVAPWVDFCLCSTQRMAEVASQMFPDRPSHVMNDPFGNFDPASLGESIEARLAETRDTSTIKVAWSGIGDNPHFGVGLQDLAAYGHMLRSMGDAGFALELRILTNKRALTAARLEMLRRLSIPFSVEEWSEEREKDALSTSLISFLPVNAQPFSIAKSLNRCVSALTSGAQVLSGGYPLYRAFDRFIYRDPTELTEDICTGRLKVRGETAEALATTMEELASPIVEVHRLLEFLLGRLVKNRSRGVPANPAFGVIHGRRTNGMAHKLTQRLGQLSIGTPLSDRGLNYDVLFRTTDEEIPEVVVNDKASLLLSEHAAARLIATTNDAGKPTQVLRLTRGVIPPIAPTGFGDGRLMKLQVLTIYAPTMIAVKRLCEQLFPGIETCFSEYEDFLIESRLHGEISTATCLPPLWTEAA